MKFFASFMQQNTVQSGLGNFDVSKSLTFATQLNGGFSSASMLIQMPASQASLLARQALGSFCTVYDSQGRYVYNGRVSRADGAADGVRITCSGIFEDGAKKTVPTALWLSPTTTNGEVITDCVALVDSWRGGISLFQLNVPVGAQDYNDETKVNTMIVDMLKVGYRVDDISPAYLVIYNDQTPEIIVERAPQFLDWYVLGADHGGKIGSSVSLQDIYNKIYVLYDDTAEDSVGPTMYPTAVNDYGSQFKYGVREGVLNVGEYGLSLGLDLQALAIQKYAQPTSGVPISVSGYIMSNAGNYVPNYMVRAGDMVGIVENDESAALHALGETTRGFVTGTNFSASNMTTKITLNNSDKRLDYLLARLGLSGGLG